MSPPGLPDQMDNLRGPPSLGPKMTTLAFAFWRRLDTPGHEACRLEQHANAGGFRTVALEEFFRRIKGFDSVICSPEQPGQRNHKRLVVTTK